MGSSIRTYALAERAPRIDFAIHDERGGDRIGEAHRHDYFQVQLNLEGSTVQHIGAITRRPQLEVLKKQVADSKKKGARVLLGGAPLPGKGSRFAPTVLADVDHTMSVMLDESFGPIIGIQVVEGDDEAVALMNDTEYGLTAGVYTPDEKRAKRLLAKLNAGSVYWNCCDRVSPRLPWSGVKHSGIGLTLSTYGIQAFTRPKAWHLRGA